MSWRLVPLFSQYGSRLRPGDTVLKSINLELTSQGLMVIRDNAEISDDFITSNQTTETDQLEIFDQLFSDDTEQYLDKLFSSIVESDNGMSIELTKQTKLKKESKPPRRCEHGRNRHYCVHCSNNGCIHGKIYWRCRICPKFCCHGLRIAKCKICRPKCQHGRNRKYCRDCGIGYCKHKRQKSHCIKCGNNVCDHGKIRWRCKICREYRNNSQKV